MHAHCLSIQIINRLQGIRFNIPTVEDQQLRNEAIALAKEAITAYENYLQFKELRIQLGFKLSLLNGFLGNHEEAVNYLLMGLEDGGRLSEIQARYKTYQCFDVLKDDRIREYFRASRYQ